MNKLYNGAAGKAEEIIIMTFCNDDDDCQNQLLVYALSIPFPKFFHSLEVENHYVYIFLSI